MIGGRNTIKPLRIQPANVLQQATAKDFRGGWNTFDTDLNLSSRYLPKLVNLYPDTNGRLRLRYGTSLFSDASSIISYSVDMTYYSGNLILVGSNGKIAAINASGAVTEIWNDTIAGALPGSPDGWNATTQVSFTQFAGTLIICNGSDKPLIVDELLAVSYLQDPGTGSNVNTPRARFCVTHDKFVVLAGMSTDTTKLSIGSEGTAFTAHNDTAPTNGVLFDIAEFINEGSPDIVGMRSFRDKLLVFTDTNVVVMTLGIFSSGTHTPNVDDVIPQHGAVSHRAMQGLGKQLMMLDRSSISSISRGAITVDLEPAIESALIQQDIQVALAPWSVTELSENCFSVYDRLSQHLMFFVPNSIPSTSNVDYKVFVYCFDPKQSFRAFTLFDGMNFTCGCRSIEGRVFFSRNGLVYFYRNDFEPLFYDEAAGSQAWDDATLWDDGTGWIEPSELTGRPISFSIEWPWSDLRQPDKSKLSRYLTLLTESDNDTGINITFSMLVDRFTTPTLTQVMTPTMSPRDGTQVVRPTNNEQVYNWPAKFKRMKMRLSGNATSRFNFIAITLQYIVGSNRR